MATSAAPNDRPARVTLAWGVHAFTASGAVVGALALLAIAAGDLRRAAVCMLIALAIDSVDGTLARAARVSDVLPRFDGRRLDDMVDYLNYVIVPAVFMVWAGSLLSWHWAAAPILASAYGFSQDDAKTEDDFFLGFPSYWNVVALYLWLFGTGPTTGTLLVTGLALLVFVPFKYVYPSRMPVLRRTTNLAAAIWILVLAACVLWPEPMARARLPVLSLAFPAYYLAMSLRLGGLHRPAE
jgi:phosphatidylcholine synthase